MKNKLLNMFIAGHHLLSRDSAWPRVRKEHILIYPVCAYCGNKDDNHVHHIVPVSVSPLLELSPDNLLTLCPRCHFCVGHFCNWRTYNKDISSLCNQYGFFRNIVDEKL